jgi:hypothetical protein
MEHCATSAKTINGKLERLEGGPDRQKVFFLFALFK